MSEIDAARAYLADVEAGHVTGRSPAVHFAREILYLAARVEALEAEVALRKAAAEEPWSFHRGSLHERLDWCRVQHLNAAENPPERPPSREAKADFDRACVEWYEEMIAQCEELEALAAVPSADEKA